MKKIIIPFVLLFLTSCVVSEYYQVYKTVPERGTVVHDKIVFSDRNCDVTYNLWSDGGDVGFKIYNKTDRYMSLDLTKTFFVINGDAYEYFRGRTISKSTNTASSLSYNYWNYYLPQTTGFTTSNSYGLTTSVNEKSLLTIPPKTAITVSNFRITESRYVDCDLVKFPSRRQIKTLKFDKTNSPFVFYNLVHYTVDNDTAVLENRFFVSEITNYPAPEMFNRVDTSKCGRKLDIPIEVFKDASPDRFYFKYVNK